MTGSLPSRRLASSSASRFTMCDCRSCVTDGRSSMEASRLLVGECRPGTGEIGRFACPTGRASLRMRSLLVVAARRHTLLVVPFLFERPVRDPAASLAAHHGFPRAFCGLFVFGPICRRLGLPVDRG